MEEDPKTKVGARVVYKDAWEAHSMGLPACLEHGTIVDYRVWTEDYWIIWDKGYQSAYPIKYFHDMFKIVGWRHG